MNTYIINKKKVCIYGCGDKGKRVLQLLKENEVEVIGFIDGRADDIGRFEGVPVFSLNSVIDSMEKDVLIIFVFKNVFQHNEIAMTLKQNGFYNIIFKPLSILNGSDNSTDLKIISDVHELLLDKGQYYGDYIPTIEETSLLQFADEGLIEENERTCKVYLPCEFLYQRQDLLLGEWSDTNIMTTFPAVDMFVGFKENKRSTYDAGVNEFLEKIAIPVARKTGVEITENWQEHVIEGRRDVYYSMKRKLILDNDFFVRNCVKVELRNNSTFSLRSSGKNRVSFFMAEGYSFFPALIDKVQYEKFLNKIQMKRLMDFLETTHSSVFAPISHPYFYSYSCKASDYMETWIRKTGSVLAKYLYAKYFDFDFSKFAVVDNLNDDGCSSRFFVGTNTQVFRIRKQKNELEDLLDKLFDITIPEFEYNRIKESKELVLFTDSNHVDYELIEKVKPVFCCVQVYNDDVEIIEKLKDNQYVCYSMFVTHWANSYVEGYVCVSSEVRHIVDRMVF